MKRFHLPPARQPAQSFRRPLMLRLRGAVAVETALLLPMMIGIAMLATDIQRLSRERAHIEQGAGGAALTLSTQPRLTRAGVDALVDLVTMGNPGPYQVVMLSVRKSGRIEWGLRRGDGAACPAISDGRDYLGELPETPEDDDANGSGNGAEAGTGPADDGQADADPAATSLLVVQVCRTTADITSYSAMWMPEQLQALSVNRVLGGTIDLDQPLTLESRASGLAQVSP
ncbi:MAG: hypothetical protein ABW202_01755 [Duganella sp.]